ncbi:MAG: endo alpha-1,4 polygalactosaminidase [Saprospiraceae bacterium]|nr:endo alpha-1,4 polygalactosaminidase [Candidatus Opimibacter iunctus]
MGYKKIGFALVVCLYFVSCHSDKDSSSPIDIDYRKEMREFVIGISDYAKSVDPYFQVIAQNGIELVSTNGEETGLPDTPYLDAIDGNGQEDLFYGYTQDDKATPPDDNAYLISFLNISKNAGNTILVTDYCSTPSKMDDSYARNSANQYISFAADRRALNDIPGYPHQIHSENSDVITSLSQARNFLYLINPDQYATKADFIQAVIASNYDLLVMDLFFEDGIAFTAKEIDQLGHKANGGSRMIICYMSIGEAEEYRYYWRAEWYTHKPSWLDAENPDWEGNFKVHYWDPEWQDIIFGNDTSYLRKIVDAGFDGVYLDIIDAFEYYE